MALEFLPRFMVITKDEEGFLQYVSPKEVAISTPLTPLAKIEVQESQINSFYVHLRFCHTNKYLALGADGWVVADADQPDEDTSSPSCTLFNAIIYTKDTLALLHIQSQELLRLREPANRAYISDDNGPTAGPAMVGYPDWASFVKTEVGDEDAPLERKICNVRYQMEYSRIFDQEPFVAGTAIAVNKGDQEVSVGVVVTFDDETSYSFARSLTATTGVSTTIEADVMGINGEGEIGGCFEATGLFEWGATTKTTKSVEARGEVAVPGRSRAVVQYVGTTGSCNAPFHYTQQDKSSGDGHVEEREEVDGIFSGRNSYNFTFQILEIQPIV